MPRSSASQAAQTKERILSAAVARASRFGLESVSIGELAGDLDMSRSGVIGPFRSRDDLLDAALGTAVSLFRATVIEPALDAPPGLPRAAAIVDRWIGYLTGCPFPGGCFVTMASVELDGRPGPRRDRLARIVARWHEWLTNEIHAIDPAQPLTSARQVATMLIGISMAANQEIQLLRDPEAGARAKAAMLRALDSYLTPVATRPGRGYGVRSSEA
jgi:AcrR family transcriptional regulator